MIKIFILIFVLCASPAYGRMLMGAIGASDPYSYCNSCPDPLGGADSACEDFRTGVASGRCGWTIVEGGTGSVDLAAACDNSPALGCTNIEMNSCANIVKTGADTTDQYAYKLIDASGLVDTYIQFYIKVISVTLPEIGDDWGLFFLTNAQSTAYIGIYKSGGNPDVFKWSMHFHQAGGWDVGGAKLFTGTVTLDQWYGIRLHAHNGVAANEDYVEWWVDDGPDGTWHAQTSATGLELDGLAKVVMIGDSGIARPVNFYVTGIRVDDDAMPGDCVR